MLILNTDSNVTILGVEPCLSSRIFLTQCQLLLEVESIVPFTVTKSGLVVALRTETAYQMEEYLAVVVTYI